jgi:hypothetical protein
MDRENIEEIGEFFKPSITGRPRGSEMAQPSGSMGRFNGEIHIFLKNTIKILKKNICANSPRGI